MGGSSDSEGSGSTTYETVEDYIAELNGDSEWITYDSGTNTASISGLVGFVNACKSPSKDVCAFDALDRSQAENKVFGTGDEDALHFDFCTADLLLAGADTYAELEGWDSSYPDEYAADLEKADELGNLSEGRQNLYNPMYYLCPSYDGEGTSVPAPHWRIRTGIEQGDTASATEINLALALQQAAGVESVDFETVWGQGHTTAERTGDSTSNFISWVQSCCA